MGGIELHQLQQRMQAGRLNRARRGEWLGTPPAGYITARPQLQFDPDEQASRSFGCSWSSSPSEAVSGTCCVTCGSSTSTCPFACASARTGDSCSGISRSGIRCAACSAILPTRGRTPGAGMPAIHGGRYPANGVAAASNGSPRTVRCSCRTTTPPT
jgi:hypothetical protein